MDWKIHEDFYLNIGRYLNPGAILAIGEFQPLQTIAYWWPNDPRGPLDIRKRPSIEDFSEQIDNGGLILREVAQEPGTFRFLWFVVSEKPLVENPDKVFF
jgi:hypothetical protein